MAKAFELLFELDCSRAGWREDWTMFLRGQPAELDSLASPGPLFEAYLNRKINPHAVRVEYEAVMVGPDETYKRVCDLSCHIGLVFFGFGSSMNRWTGIYGPGKAEKVANPPLIQVGQRHRVTVEVLGRRCRMEVDGKPAAEMLLDEELCEGALRLYSWCGVSRFEKLRVYGPAELAPMGPNEAPGLILRQRLDDMRQSIVWIEHQGKFLHECSLSGEGRADVVYPAHPNGIQLSRDRFLLLYSTRAFRGDDDEKSGIYQLRSGGFDGPVIKEGWVCRTQDDWDPLGDGQKYVRQHGHPVAFGVPKGALVRGRRAPHENIFAVIWRREARWIDPKTGFMCYVAERFDLVEKTQALEWMQFRLNDAEDDIEIVQPPQRLRQIGFEEGAQFCSEPRAKRMNLAYVPPAPFNDDCSEWINANALYADQPRGERDPVSHRQTSHVAPMRYRFNPARRLYEWVETGPMSEEGIFEASVLKWRGDWIICARRSRGDAVAWMRCGDPFAERPQVHLRREQRTNAPLCAFACPDGIVRRTGGWVLKSPSGSERDPLYLIDVDPDRGFAVTHYRAIFNGRLAGVPIPPGPILDMCKLMPHTGGQDQLLLHRLRTGSLNDPATPDRRMTPDEIAASGIYAARIHYRDEWPATWTFTPDG